MRRAPRMCLQAATWRAQPGNHTNKCVAVMAGNAASRADHEDATDRRGGAKAGFTWVSAAYWDKRARVALFLSLHQ